MAEVEDVTLDGKPLHSLRVADLKAALEQRGLAKSGQKNALIKRLKGALMLENLQRTSTHHIGLQPNSQIGEEMSQNSFIKQYLAKQQELLRQRLEREAREATEADVSHESPDTKAGRIWHPSFPPGHEEVATPSPPRAVASLSVRVVGQPERQGLPLMMPRSQEREGTAPVEAGPAHSVLQLSRSARAAACAQVDSDDNDEDDEDDSDDDDEWGPTSHGKKSIRTPPVHTPPAAAPQRSRRKLQPPQHIPPQPQPVHQPPLQLRQPTPPPSPPPELSFPLPDTPKQKVEGGEMEVEKQEDGKAEVQDSAQQLLGSEVSVSVPTMPPAQQDAQDSELERDEQKSEEKENEKVDETSAPFHLTSPTTFPPRSPHIFSEVPPPDSLTSSSNPEQVSVLTSLKCSEDIAMETEASTTISESKHEEDKEVKVLEKKPPKPAEESEKALKSPHSTSEEGEMDETRDRSRRGKGHGRRSSMPSQTPSSDTDSESSSSHSSSSPSQDKSSPPSQKKVCNWLIKPMYFNSVGYFYLCYVVQFCDTFSLALGKTEIASSEAEPVGGASRKRRWGSSTAVTAKKPSISITTESLKTLIPDIKPLQEAVVELHPDEGRLSGDEDSSGPREQEEPEEDQGLMIRRTVTQIVPLDGHENGQKEMEEEDEEEEQKWTKGETEKQRKQESSPDASMEIQDGESKKVTPSDSLVRRSISQQKSGVSITIDDPIRTGRQLSPPRGKTSNIIHVYNLVRPFTLGQLKELLNQTGKLVEEGFWIDKIKSHCYVTYSTVGEAVATREALHGVKWPTSNPKVLRVDFCEQDELDFHKGLVSSARAVEGHDLHASGTSARPAAHHPLPPANHEKEKEREREREGGALAVREQWAERERAMERRERTRSEREWDRDKIKDFGKDDRDRTRRSRSRERRRREKGKSKEKRTEKKDKPEEPPVKLLDDLFHKTKAAPCIYWLPLTDEQATQRALERAERIKEREKRRKELQEEQDKKQEERRERAKGRDREGGNAGVVRRSTEGERDRGKERERERGREAEKRRDSHRVYGSDSKTAGGSRRSQSRSNTSRDRRH
uniref:Apoptotic chromatin condensation inducer in the nucleus-like n=1 Tax=Sinocyclocheilus anshuiensis TaxID=1608454 RepID=A0A671P839_9TELE